MPFVIEEFVAECGCVKVKGSKGLVAPGQSKTIIVEVVATAWDNKSSVKSVEVKIPRAVDPIRFSVRSISQPKATENRR